MKKHIALLAGLIALLSPAAASADCLEGLRNSSAGEMAYYKRVAAALKAALPAPPPNWKLAPARDRDLGGLCNGDREGAFEIKVTASYAYTPPKDEADRLYAEYRKLQAEIDALKNLPPELAKERQGWLNNKSGVVDQARLGEIRKLLDSKGMSGTSLTAVLNDPNQADTRKYIVDNLRTENRL